MNDNTSGKIKFSMVCFTLASFSHGVHRPVLSRKCWSMHTAHNGPWWPAVHFVEPLRKLDRQVFGRGHAIKGVAIVLFGTFQ